MVQNEVIQQPLIYCLELAIRFSFFILFLASSFNGARRQSGESTQQHSGN